MLVVRVPKPTYLDLDQLPIARNPGLLVVSVPKPRYLDLDQLPIARNPGLLVVRVPKPRYLDLEQLSIAYGHQRQSDSSTLHECHRTFYAASLHLLQSIARGIACATKLYAMSRVPALRHSRTATELNRPCEG